MAKIKDRLILGAIAGLGGNIAKNIIVKTAKKLKWAEVDGAEMAAGMLIPPYRIADPEGKVVGYIADNIIAGMLGVATVYTLSLSGKDKAVLKGVFTGQAAWAILYGLLTTMGATKVHSVSPKSVLSEFAGHTAFGALTAYLATKLGDPGLFTGKIPLTACSQGQSTTAQSTAGQSQQQQLENTSTTASSGSQGQL